MGREYGLVRIHQPRSSKEKERSSPNLLNDLVNGRITLEGAQGLVSQILKRELTLFGEDIVFRVEKQRVFLESNYSLIVRKTDCKRSNCLIFEWISF